ncbi:MULTISPECIES: recombinase family protein [Acidithiobacillus]|uniref:Recombinase family protein n=2 Tax=Acidithiobacillus ferruginosus TaxID=3063951 RepID=A0ACD5IQ06_9PROT|nr:MULTISPECIES: recombinase family protein [Acidithiobacillus]MBU2806696.1 recombinase family protein [Acidithiobacillus ferridurans]MBU2814259.1 recombinase family protein [Acidithiobacillus ferruginosus]MBU2824939.1 recombinase family protein [Acidithiobacillus ferrooxidans]
MATKPAPSARKTVAYLRVSTLDQDLEKNKADILQFANHHDLGKVHFVEEIASGRKPWRERLIAQVLEELRGNDAIIVAELSRLGRSMLECMEILALATRKGICVYSVKGNWQLDHSIQSKIIALAFSMAAEIERDLISQRTKEALRFKKDQGITLGRPKGPGKSKLDPFRPEIESLLANGSTQKFIAQRYHTTEANLHNWLKKRGMKTTKTDTPA